MLIILSPRGRPHREVFFRRRRSLSFIISVKSATGRISTGPSPYLNPGCFDVGFFVDSSRSCQVGLSSSYNVRGFRQSTKPEAEIGKQGKMNDLYGVALGGVLGIVGAGVGQLINGRREQRRWIADNRKQEYRELLTTLTNTATFLMEYFGTSAAKDPEHSKRFTQVYGDALRVISDRIFIAEEIKKANIHELWIDALAELQKTKDIHLLSERFEAIRVSIIKSAVKNPRLYPLPASSPQSR